MTTSTTAGKLVEGRSQHDAFNHFLGHLFNAKPAVSINWGSISWVSTIRSLLFGVHIGASDFWKVPTVTLTSLPVSYELRFEWERVQVTLLQGCRCRSWCTSPCNSFGTGCGQVYPEARMYFLGTISESRSRKWYIPKSNYV